MTNLCYKSSSDNETHFYYFQMKFQFHIEMQSVKSVFMRQVFACIENTATS